MASTNLPVQLTSFVGREREIAGASTLLFNSHLVTLTGAGGSGKTRLAIQIASGVSETFADGVWLVDFAPLHEPALVPQSVIQALGLHLHADQSLLEALLSFVRSKQLLLILDNCEHLSAACAQLAQELLSQAPGLRIVATSREPLAIAGETIYPVSGLAWPAVYAAQEEKPQDLMQYDAVRLFVERGRAISPNFNLTTENAWPTIEICRRLDGLPLALELASARVNVLTVQEIATRLNNRFDLLISAQRRGLEPRHHTLRAAIDWSYALLAVDEQILLRRLAVFGTSFTLDTVEAVCTGEGIAAEHTLDRISSLVSKSLVVADTDGQAQARYRLLETICEYAFEKLEAAGESRRLRDRHLDLFLARAEEAAPRLNDAYQQLWLNWLEGEHDNLRTALAWALESGRIEEGLRIAIALVQFWDIRGYGQEGLVWFEHLLAQTDDRISLGIRVNALVNASAMAMAHGNAQVSIAYGLEAVEVAETAGDEGNPLLAFAQGGLLSGAQAAGDYQTVFTISDRAIRIYRESGPSYYLRMALYLQGESAIQLGYYDTARERLDESLALSRQDGDSFQIANSYNAFGDLSRLEQNYTQAASAYEDAAVLLRELGAPRELASIIGNQGYTCLHLGKVEQAYTLFSESMTIHQAQQNNPGKVECLIGFAAAAVMGGLPAAGVRLFAAAAAISKQPSASKWRATRMEFERYNDLARANLSGAEFQAEQAAGRAMSLEQAVDFALNLSLKAGIEPSVRDTPDDLTRREGDVAALIGQGKTNSEIALELVLSKRTVETHVSNILSKLGLTSRSQVMLWAIDQGLTQTST